ncbi:hypothetical protein VNO80_00306 [Phaseolus coccineus]|uniref:Uncharacterized protein n=1 Tax=Phaseolus coccineus TaxID=3886 RepID=A0AAN9P3W6_PHACN
MHILLFNNDLENKSQLLILIDATLEAAPNPFSKARDTQQKPTWKLNAAHKHGVVLRPPCESTTVHAPCGLLLPTVFACKIPHAAANAAVMIFLNSQRS